MDLDQKLDKHFIFAQKMTKFAKFDFTQKLSFN